MTQVNTSVSLDNRKISKQKDTRLRFSSANLHNLFKFSSLVDKIKKFPFYSKDKENIRKLFKK